MSRRNSKRGQQDGDVSDKNILPPGSGKRGRTPNKKAKNSIEEEKEEGAEEVIELMGRIEEEFQVEEGRDKEEEEENPAETYDPPANQEQEQIREEEKEEENRKDEEEGKERKKKKKRNLTKEKRRK
jgi:TATA-binding protein-associated factor Taf7